jgi:hypothetical protein
MRFDIVTEDIVQQKCGVAVRSAGVRRNLEGWQAVLNETKAR